MNERDPLEALAGRRHQREAETARAARLEHKLGPSKAASKQSKTLKLSLESRSFPVLAATLLLSVGAAVLVTITAAQFSEDETILGIVGALAWIGAFLLVDALITGYERARELRWLERLPFGFDRDAYLVALSINHGSNAKVELRVEFCAPIPEHARATVRDAVAEACFGRVGGLATKPAESSVRFEADALQVESPPIQTRFTRQSGEGESKPVHHNRFVHRWLRRCIDAGLSTVHARYPIDQLHISLR